MMLRRRNEHSNKNLSLLSASKHSLHEAAQVATLASRLGGALHEGLHLKVVGEQVRQLRRGD